jgi:hypothetical protein
MASNALAPRAKNALVQDPLQELLTRAAAYPQYNDLVNFLMSRQAMPKIKQEYLGPGTSGEFVYDTLGGTGTIGVNYGAEPSTIVHELTHAADRQIGNLSYNLEERHRKETPFFDRLMGRSSLTPEEQQLVDARKKLYFDVQKKIGDLARYPRESFVNKLAPEWAKQKRDYRASDNELIAYGMGSTIAPNTYNRAPAHVDPTMATEFSIMLDLAQRAQAKAGKK